MKPKHDMYITWWIETSRNWIIRAFGDPDVGYTTEDFGELLCNNIHEREMNFRDIAGEWDVSLDVLAELVADHIRRLDEPTRED